MYVVKIYSSWHFALLREQGRLRNKPKLFQVKIDEVTPTKLANKISLGHFAVGNKFTGLCTSLTYMSSTLLLQCMINRPLFK